MQEGEWEAGVRKREKRLGAAGGFARYHRGEKWVNLLMLNHCPYLAQ